jgi:hypothetical protein
MCLLLIPIVSDAQTRPRVVSLPRPNGYQLHCSQHVFLDRLSKAGLTVVPDSITYSRYFYDTSAWAVNRTVQEKGKRVYYWRMLGFSIGQDTIPVVNLFFDTYAPDKVKVSSYKSDYFPMSGGAGDAQPDIQKESNKVRRARWAVYRKTHRRYTRILRKEFVHKYIKV